MYSVQQNVSAKIGILITVYIGLVWCNCIADNFKAPYANYMSKRLLLCRQYMTSWV